MVETDTFRGFYDTWDEDERKHWWTLVGANSNQVVAEVAQLVGKVHPHAYGTQVQRVCVFSLSSLSLPRSQVKQVKSQRVQVLLGEAVNQQVEHLFEAALEIYETSTRTDTLKQLGSFHYQGALQLYLADVSCAFTVGESDLAPFDFGLIFKGHFVTELVRSVCFKWVAGKLTQSTHYQTALQTVRLCCCAVAMLHSLPH